MKGFMGHQHRRGMSLIELLAAMTAASVVVTTSAALVHRSFAFESRSRQVLADERTALRLARQFRADVHAARAVQGEAAEAAEHTLVALAGLDGRVTYRRAGTGVERVAEPLGGEPGREHYRFSRPVDWEVAATGRLVTLRGRASGEQSRQPWLTVEVVAARPAAAGGVP